jgi:hypothetical protein
MRRATALAALAFALSTCTSSNTLHPVITGLRNGALSVSPLPVCAGIAPDPFIPPLTLVGSGFVPNVNLVSDDPQVSYGTARFVGPATVEGAVSFISALELSIGVRATQFVPGQPLVPPGAYDFVFIDSDGGEFLGPHAVDFVLPPQVSGAQPSSICPDREETVTVSGSGFTPGPTTVTAVTFSGFPGPSIPATATADSVVVTIPAGSLPPSSPSTLVVKDASGCGSPMFTVTTTPACGP